MKKSTLKKILAGAAVVALAAAAAACSDKTAEEPIQDPIEVSISIDFPEGAGVEDISEQTFLVEDGTTVLDALQIYCNVNDIPVNVETTAASVYGINGVNNSDASSENAGEAADAEDTDITADGEGEGEGASNPAVNGSWHYSINGEEGTGAESEVKLSDGDSIIWIYQ